MKRISCGLLACTAFIGTGAFATTMNPSLYFFLGGGYAQQDSMPGGNDFPSITGSTGNVSTTTQKMGGRTGLGLNWDTGEHTSTGIELAAALYGSTEYSQNDTSLTLNYYGIELLGVGRLHLGKFSLIGKAGLVDERVHPAKENFTSPNGDNIESNDTILPEVGAGFGYHVGKHARLSTMYYHTFGDDVSFSTQTDVTNLPSIDAVDLEVGFFY